MAAYKRSGQAEEEGTVTRTNCLSRLRTTIGAVSFRNLLNPKLNGLTIPINGIYNGWRMEEAWLDR